MTQIDSPSDLPGLPPAIDAPCRKCGYNLRGLPIDGRCPECNTPVWISRNGDQLQHSDPKFVHSLRIGVRLILWNLLLTFLLSVAIIVFSALMRTGPLSIYTLLLIASSIVGVIGAWLLTVPDPSGLGEERYGTARKIIRFTVVIGATHSMLDFLVKSTVVINPMLHTAIQGLDFIVAITALAGQFAELKYLSKLALRIPDPALAARAHFLMFAYGVSLGVFILVGFIVSQTSGIVARSGTTAGACSMGIIGIAVMVFWFMYIGMLVRFGRAFQIQAETATKNWMRAHSLIIDQGHSAS